VLSRCLQFNLKQMPPPQIIGHLENILQQESVEYETPALRLLAQGARGSMRDALSLTDQAIAYAAGKVTLEAVQGMLGALDQSFLVRLLDALAVKDGGKLIEIADEMAALSLSYGVALQDMGSLLHRISLAQTAPSALPDDLPEREDILRLAELFDPEEIQLFYQIAVHGRNELNLAPDEYAGFTMSLMRMLAFRPNNDGNAPARQAPAPASSSKPPPARPAGTSPAKAALEAARVKPKTAGTAAPKAAEKPPVAPPARTTATPAGATISKLDWNGDWPQLAAILPVRGVVQQLAQQTELVDWENTDSGAKIHLRSPVETLSTPANLDRLGAALTAHFGQSVRVTAEIGKVDQTASKKATDERAERLRQAEQTIQNDPFVQSLMSEFGASIVPGSIKPA
jgi:DNA polymerase-3 subunit gamma/tau